MEAAGDGTKPAAPFYLDSRLGRMFSALALYILLQPAYNAPQLCYNRSGNTGASKAKVGKEINKQTLSPAALG